MINSKSSQDKSIAARDNSQVIKLVLTRMKTQSQQQPATP
jgi:hypothetical protein